MKENGLLETWADQAGVFISDLRQRICSGQELERFLSIPDEAFPIRQWNEAVGYLCGKNCDFSSVREAKKFLRRNFRK